MADYLDKDFVVKAEGPDFELTFHGAGNMDAGKAAVEAMTGLPCSVMFTGLTPEERADLEGH